MAQVHCVISQGGTCLESCGLGRCCCLANVPGSCPGGTFCNAMCMNCAAPQGALGCKPVECCCPVVNQVQCGNGILNFNEQCDPGQANGGPVGCQDPDQTCVFPCRCIHTCDSQATQQALMNDNNILICQFQQGVQAGDICADGVVGPCKWRGDMCQKMMNQGEGKCKEVQVNAQQYLASARGWCPVLRCTGTPPIWEDCDDLTDCPPCGNGVIDAGEECERPGAASPHCAGFGVNLCGDSCKCLGQPQNCNNNGVVDPGEQCDTGTNGNPQPNQQGTCGNGQSCNGACRCVDTADERCVDDDDCDDGNRCTEDKCNFNLGGVCQHNRLGGCLGPPGQQSTCEQGRICTLVNAGTCNCNLAGGRLDVVEAQIDVGQQGRGQIILFAVHQWAGNFMNFFEEWFGEKEAWAGEGCEVHSVTSGIEVSDVVCISNAEGGGTVTTFKVKCLAAGIQTVEGSYKGIQAGSDTVMCKGPNCGNGTVDQGEECDDGNGKNGDGCSSACQRENTCGNGTVDSGETCGEPDLAACGAGYLCSQCNCIVNPLCGNGVLDAGEDCDPKAANRALSANCDPVTCKNPGCGNTEKEAGEACDDGNKINCDGCSSNCQKEPPPPAVGAKPNAIVDNLYDLRNGSGDVKGCGVVGAQDGEYVSNCAANQWEPVGAYCVCRKVKFEICQTT